MAYVESRGISISAPGTLKQIHAHALKIGSLIGGHESRGGVHWPERAWSAVRKRRYEAVGWPARITWFLAAGGARRCDVNAAH